MPAVDFADIGQDFEDFGPGLTSVTVLQINPNTGATLATSTGVTALKRVVSIPGGEVGSQVCRFFLRASEVSFVPRERDQVLDAEGITWSIGDVDTIGFGAIHRCENCTRKRT